jgi:hypothetical protein
VIIKGHRWRRTLLATIALLGVIFFAMILIQPDHRTTWGIALIVYAPLVVIGAEIARAAYRAARRARA